MAWADRPDPTATAKPSTRVLAQAVATGLEGGNPLYAENFPRKSFSTKTTFVPFDYIDGGVLKMSKRDLERQGRPSRGTPTPPRYRYLTRHLPGKAAHARISDSATDEQVLMLKTRGKKHGFIPKCSGLSSHKEQTHVLGITMLRRCRQHPWWLSRPTADISVLGAITFLLLHSFTNGTQFHFRRNELPPH